MGGTEQSAKAIEQGPLSIGKSRGLSGCVRVPGDKSISHRALLLGCLADGSSRVRGFLPANDCLATLGCVRALGIAVETSEERRPTSLTIHGRGLHGLRRPDGPLNCVRSGTTMRLLAGVLAGQPFTSVLTGDPQLLRRPMGRIARPLRCMGAEIDSMDGHAPLTIRGRRLRGHEHRLPVASAQVKSAILLAGLYAKGATTVHQPGPARDHTELMLGAMGAEMEICGLSVRLTPPLHGCQSDGDVIAAQGAGMAGGANRLAGSQTRREQEGWGPLMPLDTIVPGDVSSACFLLVGGLLVSGSEVTVEGVGVNRTRTGLFDVLRRMDAEVAVCRERDQGGEPVADVTVRASSLQGAEVGGDTVVRMIDEFPLLAVAGTQARGTTVVRDAAELRVKETDRIAVMASELGKMGADIEARQDGFAVRGPTVLRGAAVESHGDHRIAMALAVAGLVADGETVLHYPACIQDSFPGFVETLQQLGACIG